MLSKKMEGTREVIIGRNRRTRQETCAHGTEQEDKGTQLQRRDAPSSSR